MTTPMFPDDTVQQWNPSANVFADGIVAESDHSRKIRNSALWAAYGDALGWISELTDAEGLLRRTGGGALEHPIEWRRRIGGLGGVVAALPVGCYSDDTQLRLATCRAVRHASFDVEAFAKVELPVWLSYALGGGKGTNAAAANLSKPKVPWFANTFNGWTQSGGNGAAMRIQPHVWAARTPENPESFLTDVIRNAVCTHSHPTGIIGAVIHAASVAHTIATERIPSPNDLGEIITIAAGVPALMRNDFELWNYWRSAFEREKGQFDEAWGRAIADAKNALQAAIINPAHLTGAKRYSAIVDNLMLREKEHIGSGILTAIAAVGLTWCETQPEEALRIAANEIGTDTDTIATMAGAILGVVAEAEPPVEVQDAELLRSEANRLSEIAQGGRPPSHRYPDLLHWSAPKTRSDALMQTSDGALYISGLGLAEAQSEPITAPKGDFMWQWLRVETGQTLLLKRRAILLPCDRDIESLSVLPRSSHSDSSDGRDTKLAPDAATHSREKSQEPQAETLKRPLDLPGALSYIKENINSDRAIGGSLRRVVARGTHGEIAAFTAALIDYLRKAEEMEASE